jgi:hypothetical protein
VVGVIILLNVLIAVVSDSYVQATAGAKSLFGKARVGFLAEHMALEQFLQPGTNPLQGIDQELTRNPRECLSIISRTIRWIALLGLLVTAFFAEVYVVGRAINAVLGGSSDILVAFFMILMAAILTIGLWVVIHDLLQKTFGTLVQKYSVPILTRLFRGIDWVMVKSMDYLRTVAFGDFGIDDDIKEDDSKEYLEKVIREVVAESERNLVARIQRAEGGLRSHEQSLSDSLRYELRNHGSIAGSK